MSKKFELIIKLFLTYICLLALCLIFYTLIVLPTNGAEKVNAIIGLLGWSATIFAPIAAFYLIDNWKEQTKYNEQLSTLSSMIDETMFLVKNLSEHRTDQKVAQHLANCYHLLSIENLNVIKTREEVILEFKDSTKNNAYPDFGNLQNNINNLKRLYLLLDLHIDKNCKNNNILILLGKIESLTNNFRNQVSYLYMDYYFIKILYDQNKSKWIENATFVNDYTYELIILFEKIEESKQKAELENTIQNLLKEIKVYKSTL